jgi:hypothetical protein
MLAFKLEISKRATSQGVTADTLTKSIVANGAAELAEAIRTRVQVRGDIESSGQRFPGYSPRRGRKATAPGYPDRAHGKVGPSGAEWYPSAAEYHYMANGTEPGTYSPTGGMWDGLASVIQSATRADIMFRGRSTGRDPNFKRRTQGRPKKGQARQTKVVARAMKINNALKAATILQQHGVNVLAPSQQEVGALTEGIISALAFGLGGQLPIEWQGGTAPLPPDQAFAHRHWG